MPNYNLTARMFQPFTYDELIKPLEKLNERHEKTEEALSELSVKAGQWEKLADSQIDRETYLKYKAYADDLRNAADELAMHGISAVSRKNLFDMKARYANEIVPIEEAYTRRLQQADKQMEWSVQNSDLIFDRDAATTSLDEYRKNPTLGIKAIDGNAVRKEVLTQASLLGKEQNHTELRRLLDNNKDYWEYVKKSGFSSDAILKAISMTEGADEKLVSLLDKAVSATGVYSWKDKYGNPNMEAINRVKDYAAQGLWGAIGTQDTQLVEDWRTQMEKKQTFDHNENELNRQLQERMAQLQTEGFKVTGDDGSVIYVDKGVVKSSDGNMYKILPDGTSINLTGGGGNSGAPTVTSPSGPSNYEKKLAKFNSEAIREGSSILREDVNKMTTYDQILEKFDPVYTIYPSIRGKNPFKNTTVHWTAATNGRDMAYTMGGGTDLPLVNGGDVDLNKNEVKYNATYIPYSTDVLLDKTHELPSPVQRIFAEANKRMNLEKADEQHRLHIFAVYNNPGDRFEANRVQYVIMKEKGDNTFQIPETDFSHSYPLNGTGGEARYLNRFVGKDGTVVKVDTVDIRDNSYNPSLLGGFGLEFRK